MHLGVTHELFAAAVLWVSLELGETAIKVQTQSYKLIILLFVHFVRAMNVDAKDSWSLFGVPKRSGKSHLYRDNNDQYKKV